MAWSPRSYLEFLSYVLVLYSDYSKETRVVLSELSISCDYCLSEWFTDQVSFAFPVVILVFSCIAIHGWLFLHD